ncbi:uncharacterized protein RBU33_027708 [Hipposideros larvatus]
MVVEGAARTWERRRIRGRLPENGGPCVPTTPARRPAEILHPSETQELAPSRSGGDAPTANRAKSRIGVQPGPRRWVHYEDRRAGSNKGETPTSSLRDPHARAGQMPRALHLSWIRPAAPECGKRGSCGRYKGWPRAHEHCAGGTRGGGWEPVPRGRAAASGSTLSPAPPRPPAPGEARAEAPPPRGAGLGHLDAAWFPKGGAKTRVRVPGTLREPASGVSGRVWDGGETHACGRARILSRIPHYTYVARLLRLLSAVTVSQIFLSLKTFTVLKSAGKAFCTMFLNWDLSDVFPIIRP